MAHRCGVCGGYMERTPTGAVCHNAVYGKCENGRIHPCTLSALEMEISNSFPIVDYDRKLKRYRIKHESYAGKFFVKVDKSVRNSTLKPQAGGVLARSHFRVYEFIECPPDPKPEKKRRSRDAQAS